MVFFPSLFVPESNAQTLIAKSCSFGSGESNDRANLSYSEGLYKFWLSLPLVRTLSVTTKNEILHNLFQIIQRGTNTERKWWIQKNTPIGERFDEQNKNVIRYFRTRLCHVLRKIGKFVRHLHLPTQHPLPPIRTPRNWSLTIILEVDFRQSSLNYSLWIATIVLSISSPHPLLCWRKFTISLQKLIGKKEAP